MAIMADNTGTELPMDVVLIDFGPTPAWRQRCACT